MENNVVVLEDRKTALEEGVKKGHAIAQSIIADDEFEANIDNVAAWAESINLEQTVGNAYAIIAMSILRCMLGNELYDTPITTEDGEFSDEAMNKGMNAILDRLGLELKDGNVTVRIGECADD